MDLAEIGTDVIKKLENTFQDQELVSKFMQNITEMTKITKFINERLKQKNILVNEINKLLDDKAEYETIIAFWIDLFKQFKTRYEIKQFTSPVNEHAADGKYYDPYNTPF